MFDMCFFFTFSRFGWFIPFFRSLHILVPNVFICSFRNHSKSKCQQKFVVTSPVLKSTANHKENCNIYFTECGHGENKENTIILYAKIFFFLHSFGVAIVVVDAPLTSFTRTRTLFLRENRTSVKLNF